MRWTEKRRTVHKRAMTVAAPLIRIRHLVAGAALALAACSAGAPAEKAQPPHSPQAAAAPSLYGRWQIVEVNGAPARSHSAENRPSVTFEPGRYGGSSGCNSFGGNGLLVGGRWFAEPPMATQQGCAELDRQESTIFDLLSGGPSVAIEGEGALLRTAAGSLRLRRIGPASDKGGARPPQLMAGTRWELNALDGAPVDPRRGGVPARLTLEADRWTLETPCGAREGPWRQLEGAVELGAGAPTARPCTAELARRVEALAGALTGRLDYVVGPNGELVLANGRNWVTGGSDRSFAQGDRTLLSGRWRIVSVDGAPPSRSERPAELAFGPGAFAVWDGCMHSEGVAIVAGRQLFTRGSGMVTMANCPDDPIRRKINSVVGSAPRVGRIADGLALVSATGTIRLQRSSAQAFGVGVATRLQPGMAFDLMTGPTPGARLTLTAPDRFTVSFSCGSFSGRWRNAREGGGDVARFGPDGAPPECGGDASVLRLYGFFTGNLQAAIGPNKDIALFVNRGESLPARVSNGRGASR